MVRAWYIDDSLADQRLEHHRNPPEFLELDELFKLTGVECFKIDHENYENDKTLKKLRNERGYSYEDEINCSKESVPDYEEKWKNVIAEHLHSDEEVRLVLDGCGYFDVRDGKDQWIRIEATAGDFIIIPSGIYHRLIFDMKVYIKAKCYFVGEQVSTSHRRPVDEMACRKEYLDRLTRGFEIASK